MLKRLAGCIRQYRRETALAPVFVMLEVIMEVIIPILMANLIDYGINKGNMAYILKTGGALLGFAALSMLFGTMAGLFAATASSGFARNLRRDMYLKVQNFSFSNIDKFSTASIVTRLTTDVTNIQNAFQTIVRAAFRAPFMIIFSLAVSFSINTKISLIFLAVIPFLGSGLVFIIYKAHPVFVTVFDTYDELNGVVAENLSGIRVVKSFNREEYEKRKFGKVSGRIYRYFTKAEKLVAFNMPLMEISIFACMMLISWVGARLVVASGGNPETGLSTGQLMSLFTYAMQILGSLMLISMVLVMIVIANASAGRAVELLNEESDLKNCEKPVFSVKNGDICFRNVNFSYVKSADKLVLENINLTIKSGETVGIVGSTGSSKTSLVQLIPRLYDTVSGQVTVGGTDVREYDLETLREAVAMVLQKNVLFSGTIRENLLWGNENASDEELIKACRLAQADGFIESFPKGYDTYIEQGGTNVSGGQKQRICIARALLKKPMILILDDSTSAVDTKTDALIRKAMKENIPETTKIIIAQRISSVMDADKIVVMDDGRISAVGTHSELLEKSPIYREVYESQIRGGMISE
ncbi:MAG: ABC transporter ATP-binding protein [Bacillota bacterium]|nr:ABC transporter ATP-binding protein [Bacillota bacterium]